MKTLGNVLWVVLGGFFWSISTFILSFLCFATVILFPFGIQLYKLAKFIFWPFGKQVVDVNVTIGKEILNVFWLILLGWEIALLYFLYALLLFITFIGAPFGMQYLKIARFALLPLGRDFR